MIHKHRVRGSHPRVPVFNFDDVLFRIVQCPAAKRVLNVNNVALHVKVHDAPDVQVIVWIIRMVCHLTLCILVSGRCGGGGGGPAVIGSLPFNQCILTKVAVRLMCVR